MVYLSLFAPAPLPPTLSVSLYWAGILALAFLRYSNDNEDSYVSTNCCIASVTVQSITNSSNIQAIYYHMETYLDDGDTVLDGLT